MLFTSKIYVTENKKVYTQNIGPIFSGGGNKKDLSETEKSFMVHIYGTYLNFLSGWLKMLVTV